MHAVMRNIASNYLITLWFPNNEAMDKFLSQFGDIWELDHVFER